MLRTDGRPRARTVLRAAPALLAGYGFRVAALPVADADGLDGLESAVLRTLDPPLNLRIAPPSAVRRRLTELRKAYSRKRRRS